MPTPVEVPKLGNTVEECLIAKWRKQKGDRVSAGEVVADIETDKATFEVATPVDGTLLERFYPEGALAPVFANLFVVGEPGENIDAFRAAKKSGVGVPDHGETSSPKPEAKDTGGELQASPGKVFVSPRARRFAQEHRIHLAGITGSGPRGRVLEDDVRKLYYSPSAISSVAPVDHGSTAARISSIREKIARRMRESLANTAQYTLHSSADAAGLLLLRARIKASPGVPDIHINDMIVFCTVQALLDIRSLNAEYIDGKIHEHAEIHIGFACDTPRGLLVPVIRNAEKLTAGELAFRGKALAEQAVRGTISPDDLSGATFTISNLGALGIESFTPLLNPPQVAILGVDAIQVKPVRRAGKIEFIDAIGLSLTCDHQVIDGAPGARFLKTLREKIESVESLCTI